MLKKEIGLRMILAEESLYKENSCFNCYIVWRGSVVLYKSYDQGSH